MSDRLEFEMQNEIIADQEDEISRLKAEVEHWRTMAQDHGESDAHGVSLTISSLRAENEQFRVWLATYREALEILAEGGCVTERSSPCHLKKNKKEWCAYCIATEAIGKEG